MNKLLKFNFDLFSYIKNGQNMNKRDIVPCDLIFLCCEKKKKRFESS